MDRIEDMIGPTPEIEKLVRAGKVQARAMVYVNAPGGIKQLEDDVRGAGFGGPILLGRHYSTNDAVTDALRSYTGEVWLREWTPEALREAAPMLIERDSHPRMFEGRGIHCYNNPLFRLVVKLGAWDAEGGDFGSRPSAVSAVPSPELEAELARARLDRLLENAEECRKLLKHEEFVIDGLRKAHFMVSASERAEKATRLRRKLRAIVTEIGNQAKPALPG